MRSLLPLALAAVAAAGGGCTLGPGGDSSRAARDEPPDARQFESTPRPGPSPAVLERLRRGGYVLAFRHAATDFSMTDTTRDLRDCSRQRNLSAQGRRQARTIGISFRRLGIPVGRVLASPYCRTRQTARLAFGRASPSPDLISARPSRAAPPGKAGRRGFGACSRASPAAGPTPCSSRISSPSTTPPA